MTQLADTETNHANEPTASAPIAWASGALLLTGGVAVLAKLFGIIVAPGLRGVAEGKTIDLVDTGTATLAYALAALLVALVCGAAFELAKSKRVPLVVRGGVVAASGLVVALASPAVIVRLAPGAAFALSIITSVIVLGGGFVTARASHTRALGAILVLLSCAGALRPLAWMLAAMSGEHANMTMANLGTAATCLAIALQAFATLLAAVWLATRSFWSGRVAANVAVLASFGITYFALRELDGPTSALDAVLRTSFGAVVPQDLPFGFSAVSAFLVPATILLGLVALFQRGQAPAISVALTLALVAGGAFDVPLQAMAAVASAQWAMLAMADDRGMWAAMMRARQRSGVQQPTSPDSPSA